MKHPEYDMQIGYVHHGRRLLQTTPESSTSSYDNFTTSTEDGIVTMECNKFDFDYDVATAVVCAVCFIFGIVYTFFGYRFFKAVRFLTGFLFGSVFVYLVCMDVGGTALPPGGIIGVSLGSGLICGIITMLVQYIGLFMTGLHLGFAIAMVILVVLEQFYHPTTRWIPIGVLFGLGLIFGILTLRFQKFLTVLGTSVLGGALMVGCVDYYLEKFIMVSYLWRIVRAHPSPAVMCWYSWVVFGCWPFCFLVGAFIQWRVTGREVDHSEVVHNKRIRKVNLERLRSKQRQDAQQSRYRHLYQIRRVNGDVISQSYIQNVQDKSLSPSLRSMSTTIPAEPITELDSANTTLTQLP